jgi:hypothetical protein
MLELLGLCGAIAAINRLRGGGCPFFSKLPGHTRYYAAALVAAVSFIAVGWMDALLVGACYLAWALLPWGRWYDLGALEGYPNRPPTRFETLISRVAPDDAVAFTLRNCIALLPAAALLHPLFLGLALFQTAAYGIGWKYSPAAPIRTAEYLTGAIWGVFIWGLA